MHLHSKFTCDLAPSSMRQTLNCYSRYTTYTYTNKHLRSDTQVKFPIKTIPHHAVQQQECVFEIGFEILVYAQSIQLQISKQFVSTTHHYRDKMSKVSLVSH